MQWLASELPCKESCETSATCILLLLRRSHTFRRRRYCCSQIMSSPKIESVVTGQASLPLEWKDTSGPKDKTKQQYVHIITDTLYIL